MSNDAIDWCAVHGYTDEGNVLNHRGDHIADLAAEEARHGFVVFEPAVDGMDDEGEEWAGPMVCDAFVFPDSSQVAIVPSWMAGAHAGGIDEAVRPSDVIRRHGAGERKPIRAPGPSRANDRNARTRLAAGSLAS